MKRRRFNAAAFVSMTLALLVALLWVLSHWRSNDWYIRMGQGYQYGSLEAGVAELGWTNEDAFSFWITQPASDFDSESLLEFQYRDHNSNGVIDRWVQFPLWPLLLLSLPMPIVWFCRRTAKRPYACRSCGYDLRGSESRACPECGAEQSDKANPSA